MMLLGVAAFALLPLQAQPEPPQPMPEQIDLKTAIGFALKNNFAIRQAQERIRQQEGVVTEVKASQIPNVGAGAAYQRNSESISQTAPASGSMWSLNVTASQALFAGGGIRSAVRSSEFSRDAAILDLKSVINEALLTVRVSFYNVLLAREKIGVQEQNLALLQQQLKNASDRFQAGTVSGFEKLRAEVAVANAQVPLITARNDYRLAIESLRQALGSTASTDTPENLRKNPEIIGTLDITPTSYDLQSAFQSAHNNLPDLQRLGRLVSAREELITTARSNYYPDLALVGGWESRKGATNRFGDSRDGVFVGLQSQWAIFDGRATAGRVAQAKSLLSQTKLLFTEAQLAAEIEVRRAYSSFQQATELVDASGKVVAQAEESVRLATARYEAGTATQLDVLQAQVDLTTARLNQLQANYGYNVAVAGLRKAMGLTDDLVAQ